MSIQLFNVVYGRDLVSKLRESLSEPYLVVSMAALWPRFERAFTHSRHHVHLVDSLEVRDLEALVRDLPSVEVVVGLGGGMAIDVAKYIAWRRRLPLFQVPTSMSVNAPFAQRAAVRDEGALKYVGCLPRYRRAPDRTACHQPFQCWRHRLLLHSPLGLGDGSARGQVRAPVA